MEDVLLFIFTFILILVIYELFVVRKYRKNDLGERKKELKDPFEIVYLQRKYRLDMDKISYNQLLQMVAITSSFDIALIVSIVLMFKSFLLIVFGGFIITIITIVVSYHFIYLFYKKKGMIKNGKRK